MYINVTAVIHSVRRMSRSRIDQGKIINAINYEMSHKYHNMTKDVNKILFTNKRSDRRTFY